MSRRGFTLVEVLIVIVVLGLLVGLLLPAVGSAWNRALESAQVTEFGLVATSLAAAGVEPPPSRILLIESGDYSDANVPAELRPLRDRTLRYFRSRWPRMRVSVQGPTWLVSGSEGVWHDFDGDGRPTDGHAVLDGWEALVWGLGGVPQRADDGFACIGWSKNAEWPFSPDFAVPPVAHSLRGAGRIPPAHQFDAGRLVDLDGDGFPAWMDYLGQAPIAYFRHEPGAGYDPDDCDMEGEAILLYRTPAGEFSSPGPNPYTAGTVDSIDRPLRWHAEGAYQLIAAGADGKFGTGGRFVDTTDGDRLPTHGPDVDRSEESDNLTSFSRTTLR